MSGAGASNSSPYARLNDGSLPGIKFSFNDALYFLHPLDTLFLGKAYVIDTIIDLQAIANDIFFLFQPWIRSTAIKSGIRYLRLLTVPSSLLKLVDRSMKQTRPRVPKHRQGLRVHTRSYFFGTEVAKAFPWNRAI